MTGIVTKDKGYKCGDRENISLCVHHDRTMDGKRTFPNLCAFFHLIIWNNQKWLFLENMEPK